ncbi:MAG: hypothetical protein COA80_17560 [Leeuwenhoekiella sp.]|nr:MAG: hypothetical protein COA80_17560 [Leeuwenhoekiella sp.]
MKVKFLSNTIPWFGKYSGYEIIENYFPKGFKTSTVYIGKPSIFTRIGGKLLQKLLKPDAIATNTLFKTWLFFNSRTNFDLYHILYSENYVAYFPSLRSQHIEKLVITVHLPRQQWSEERILKLKNIKYIILLYKEEMDVFKKELPHSKIYYIPLGVDTDYFKPASNSERNLRSFMFLGHYLRNFRMLVQVIKQAVKQDSELIFNLVVPEWIVEKELSEVATYKQVKLHHGISDEALNDLYQSCTAMLMPMNDSGANTAIVQGISCGCPIITTDVGGIRSYGGGDIYPVVANNDVDGMVELILNYSNSKELIFKQSKQCRLFALENLSWNTVVKQHMEVYRDIVTN